MKLFFLDELETTDLYTLNTYLPAVQQVIKDNETVFLMSKLKGERGAFIVLHFYQGVLQDYAYINWETKSHEQFLGALKEGVTAIRMLEVKPEPVEQPPPPRPAMFTYEQVLELLAAARGPLRGRPIGRLTPTPTSIQPPMTELPR